MNDWPITEARIIEDAYDWGARRVRLVVRDGHSVLLGNGLWIQPEEGSVVENMGILLPRATIEPIAAAIAEWQGHVNHADTEAKILREWLEVEKGRVDRLLDIMVAE